jgi:hypothetical protein
MIRVKLGSNPGSEGDNDKLTDGDGVAETVVLVEDDKFEPGFIQADPRERTGSGSGMGGIIADKLQGKDGTWLRIFGCTYFSAKVSKMWSYFP